MLPNEWYPKEWIDKRLRGIAVRQDLNRRVEAARGRQQPGIRHPDQRDHARHFCAQGGRVQQGHRETEWSARDFFSELQAVGQQESEMT